MMSLQITTPALIWFTIGFLLAVALLNGQASRQAGGCLFGLVLIAIGILLLMAGGYLQFGSL